MSKCAYTCERCHAKVPLTPFGYRKRTQAARLALYCDGCLETHTPPRRGPHPIDTANRDLRKRAGVIATIRDQDTRELRSVHIPGTTREAMYELARNVDALDGRWLIVSLSTPNSILRDMQGSRAKDAWSHDKHGEQTAPTGTAEDPRENERMLLGFISRRDLLEPASQTILELPGQARVGRTDSDHQHVAARLARRGNLGQRIA